MPRIFQYNPNVESFFHHSSKLTHILTLRAPIFVSEKMVYISIPILKEARASFPHAAYKEKGNV